jgi:hypothetical protein
MMIWIRGVIVPLRSYPYQVMNVAGYALEVVTNAKTQTVKA